MDQPLGRMVGNALEVRGAAEVLTGDGADDLRALSLALAARLAEAAGTVPLGDGARRAEAALASGDALAAAERWVEAQGGEPAVWTQPDRLPRAPRREPVAAPADGWVAALAAREVGEAARWLGAGRLHPDQALDHAVGVEVLAKVGEPVQAGAPMALIHARDDGTAERAVQMVRDAYRLAPTAVPAPELILDEG
jgi:thymidine phosphorylase